MLAVDDAVAMVAAAFSPLPSEQVGTGAALGRVLAEDVAARLTQPPADVSSMDGYAVRASDAADVPAVLTVTGESAAGHPFTGAVEPGRAVRISTGAAVPAGADAIVIQEDTERTGDTVRILAPPEPGRWIRRRGLDFTAGRVVLPAGRRMSARDVGLAAAMNVPWLRVRRRPRIASLATGDELAMPGEPLTDGGIVSSNSLSLAALITALGGTPLDLGIARDEAAALAAMLDGARGADLLVTTGGASVGDHDLVRRVLGQQGLDLRFYRVAMRPGKPILFGRLGEVPVLGLPGNPVSVVVGGLVFVRAAMERMMGRDPGGPPETALLGEDLPANDERQEYLRARLTLDDSGRRVVRAFPRQDSSMMALLADADCLVVRPPHAPAAVAGERVPIVPLRCGTVTA